MQNIFSMLPHERKTKKCFFKKCLNETDQLMESKLYLIILFMRHQRTSLNGRDQFPCSPHGCPSCICHFSSQSSAFHRPESLMTRTASQLGSSVYTHQDQARESRLGSQLRRVLSSERVSTSNGSRRLNVSQGKGGKEKSKLTTKQFKEKMFPLLGAQSQTSYSLMSSVKTNGNALPVVYFEKNLVSNVPITPKLLRSKSKNSHNSSVSKDSRKGGQIGSNPIVHQHSINLNLDSRTIYPPKSGKITSPTSKFSTNQNMYKIIDNISQSISSCRYSETTCSKQQQYSEDDSIKIQIERSYSRTENSPGSNFGRSQQQHRRTEQKNDELGLLQIDFSRIQAEARKDMLSPFNKSKPLFKQIKQNRPQKKSFIDEKPEINIKLVTADSQARINSPFFNQNINQKESLIHSLTESRTDSFVKNSQSPLNKFKLTESYFNSQIATPTKENQSDKKSKKESEVLERMDNGNGKNTNHLSLQEMSTLKESKIELGEGGKFQTLPTVCRQSLEEKLRSPSGHSNMKLMNPTKNVGRRSDQIKKNQPLNTLFKLEKNITELFEKQQLFSSFEQTPNFKMHNESPRSNGQFEKASTVDSRFMQYQNLSKDLELNFDYYCPNEEFERQLDSYATF